MLVLTPGGDYETRPERHKEPVMSAEFILVDLGRATKETKFGFWLSPTDAITEFLH